MKPVGLKLQNFYEQIGIDRDPVLLWRFDNADGDAFQNAYRIILSDDISDMERRSGRVFDSGKICSSRQNNIQIQVNLKSQTKYYYRVCVWDQNDSPDWSDIAEFVTGICQEGWRARWISNGTSKPFYGLLEFDIIKEISEAYISVSGLGQFRLLINGEKVGSHELDPGWTDYNKQLQYATFDITRYLKLRINQLIVDVANGWYIGDTSEERHFYTFDKGYEAFGKELCLIAQILIKYTDGNESIIISDSNWKTLQSDTILSNVYGSEDFDATMYEDYPSMFFDKRLADARVLDIGEAPRGILTAQAHPPVVIKKVYDAKKITEPEEGKIIFDLGQNMSGMFEVYVKGSKGSKIRITPAEKLTPDGKIIMTCNTWSTYTLKGTGDIEVWKPRFSYAAGRWVQIEGATRNQNDETKPYIADVKGHFVSSAAEETGSFHCSDKRYEQIDHIILKSIESNLNHIHSDCPSIEKLGWLETSHLMAPSVMYNKDVDTLWNKIAGDIRDAQYGMDEYDVDTSERAHRYGPGLIPSIAPRYARFLRDWGSGSFWDIAPWGSTVILGAFEQYRFYGNKKVIEDNYLAAKTYLSYLMDKYQHSLFICHGLGDWGIGRNYTESRENTETAFFYRDLTVMARFAEILENPSDVEYYRKTAKMVLENYNDSLLVPDPETGNWCYKAYDTPSELKIMQANQALPLCFGMVPEEKAESVKQSFLDSVKDRQFISGEIGLRYIFSTLSKCGRNDIIHDMIMQPGHPSYLRFIEKGETTLPEFWEDEARSRNHDMLGHIMEWFYSTVGGISSEDGYQNIVIAPNLPGGLTSVECSYKAITGSINAKTELFPDRIEILVSIPPNTSAKVLFPKIFDRVKVFCNGFIIDNKEYSLINGGVYKYEILNEHF